MTLINLLPWRAERLKIKNNIFYFMAVATVTISVTLVFLVKLSIEKMIVNEAWNVNYLNKETSALQGQIKKIKGLQGQKELLITRSTVIQSLQASRPFVVKIFDNITRAVPYGLHLTKIVRKDNALSINGISESNAKVSLFMKNLGGLDWLKSSSLTEIKTKTIEDGAKKIEFLVEVSF